MSDIATIGFAVDTSGLAAGEAAMSKFEARAAAMEKQAGSATAALERMAKLTAEAMAKVPASMGGGAASGGGWTQSLTGATSGYVGLAAAAEGAAKATAGHAAASTEAAHATERTTGALNAGAAAHKAHGAAAYGNRLQMMELAHVGRALFDEMASGGNVLRGLAMEFGRLQIAISSGEGGITGALGRIGGLAGKLANPVALAGTAAAAAAAASAYSFVRYEDGQEALERSLNGRGRGSGMTQVQLNALARSSAEAGGLSTSEGVGLIARYTGAGLSGSLAGQLTGISREYGRITGDGTEKGADALSKAFADPIRGLGDLDRSLGFVDARLKDQIEDLVHSGQLGRAQALELDAVTKAMHGASDATWSFSKSLNGVGNWVSDKLGQLGHGIANGLGYGSDEDNLAKNRGLLQHLQTFDPVGNAPDIASLKAEIARLEARVNQTNAAAAGQLADKVERDKSGPITDAVRAALPELARARSTADTLSLLRDAMNDPDIRRFVSPDVYSSLGRAYSNTSMLARMNAPGVADRQNYEMSLSRIRDDGVQDQGLNAARRTELEILRQTGDVVRATTEAQRAYNVQLATAQERADDLARTSKQSLDLIGLSPFERAMKEVDQKYLGPRGLIESYRVDSTKVLDDKDIRGDLGGLGGARVAVTGFAEALDKAAGRLAAFPPAGAGPFGTLSAFKANDGVGPFFPAPFTGSAGPVSDHERTMVDMLVKAGFTNRAADAGFVGGMAGESTTGLDPMARNASGHRGIMQWEPSRFAGASAFGDPSAFLSQAQLAIRELQTSESAAGAMLRNATTIQGGLAANLRAERPAQSEIASSYNARLAYGTALGADLAGLTPRGTAPSVLTVHPGPATAVAQLATPGVAAIAYTGAQSATDAYHNERAGVLKSYGSDDPSAFGTPLGDSSRRLKEQSALLDIQAAGFGKSAEATKSAVAAQTLWDSYLDSGLAKTVKLSEATGGLADAVRKYGSDAERQAKQQAEEAQREKGIIDFADTTRSGASSVLSGGILSAAHGQGFSKGASSALTSFGDSLITKGVNGLMGGFLGAQGSPFGGLLGGLFGGMSLPHFAGGTSDFHGGPAVVGENGPEVVRMPPHAQVISNGALAGMAGAKAPSINVGGHSIVVQGDANEKTLAIMDQKLAAANQQQIDHVTRNWGQLQRDAGQAG